MQIQEASALTWLSDEVLQTLARVDDQLGKLAAATAQEDAPSTLEAARADIDSFAAAFDLAGCDVLCRYSMRLVAVLDQWRAEPGQLNADGLISFRAACYHLRDFLRLKQRDASFFEWVLYTDYRWLCEMTQQPAHPLQLWSLTSKIAANRDLSRDDFVLLLQQNAEHRLSFVAQGDRADVDVDAALLAFIRRRDAQAAETLRSVCDVRATQSSERKVQLCGHLLGMLIAALEQQKLEFDALLKRTLLQNLAWLKGQSNETTWLDELIFYTFLAWQNVHDQSPTSTNEASLLADLARCAQQAGWTPCKGVNYNRLYFNRYPEEDINAIEKLTLEAQQAWSHYCAVDTTMQAVDLWTAQTEPLMRRLDKELVKLFVHASDFSQELFLLLADSTKRSDKDAQIEVAAMLLVLGGVISETHGLDEAHFEERFAEMARRLRCVRLDQPTGAYAPWMLAQQRINTQTQASHVLVQVLQEALNEAESHLRAYWQTNEPSNLHPTCEALVRIQGAMYALQFAPFETAVLQVLQDVQRLQTGAITVSEQVQHDLTHSMASLSLLLDMYAQGVAASDAKLSFDSLQLPTLPVHDAPVDADATGAEEPLTTVFLNELSHLRTQALTQIERLQQTQFDDVNLVDLRRTFHTMKGGARTVGLERLAQVAWCIERALNTHLADKSIPSAAQLATLERTLMRLQDWQAQLWAAEHPTASDAQLNYGTTELEQELAAVQVTEAAVHTAPTLIDLPADWLDLPVQTVLEEPQVKTVGAIELSVPLFNAFLNEADEWSRQLALALSEWALDDKAMLAPQTQTWAHALAGSSATVQFADLASLAKATERLIERVIDEDWRPAGLAVALAQTAEEMRRLLHQFAAGFLKTYDAQLMVTLGSYLEMPRAFPPQSLLDPPLQQPLEPQLQPKVAEPVVSEEDDEIQAIFAQEGQELVTELSRVFRIWHEAPSEREQVKEALRLLHTLKGSARLAQRQDIADIAHQLESDLEVLEDPVSLPTLQQHAATIDRLEQLLQSASAVALDVSQPSLPKALPTVATSVASTSNAPKTIAPIPLHLVPAGETIRVKSSTIDRLVNQAGEVMIARSRMETETTRAMHTLVDLGAQAQRLRDQLRELELQTEMQMQSRQAKLSDQASAFDPLELDRFTRAQELTRFMAEAVSDITTLQRTLQQSLSATEDHLAAQRRQAIDMQRYLLSTRMVEFNSVGERLMRLVRLTAQEVGVSAELKIENGALEMDRAVIERMLPAFEHLLRNAIVHGLEPESDRQAKGKSAIGTITITLEQTGKDVRMTVQDDGRGIDSQAVLSKAEALYGQLPTQEPLQLIFTTGLSTASHVTELAGRGVGMDVVRAHVQALGGQIDLASEPDTGTSFKLILPLTTAVTQIVLVRTASLLTAIPVNLVLTTLRIKQELVTQGLEAGHLTYGDKQTPFYRLAPLIQAPLDDWRVQSATIPVIVLQSASQTMALQVDEVLGSQEAVVKNLGPQLSQMPGLTGMTVLPTGETVLIYNPVALATVYGAYVAQQLASAKADVGITQSSSHSAMSSKPHEQLAPLVVVVDDSITMRRVLQRLLQREGYRVAQAADGRQALDLLSVEKPAMVLSDVEMPRMDGFELLQQIRSSERLQDLPVVMITSRIADKHRDHAAKLGANAYLGKPYPEAELLALIERFAGKASA